MALNLLNIGYQLWEIIFRIANIPRARFFINVLMAIRQQWILSAPNMCWVCLNIRNWILPCLHEIDLLTGEYREGCRLLWNNIEIISKCMQNKRRLKGIIWALLLLKRIKHRFRFSPRKGQRLRCRSALQKFGVEWLSKNLRTYNHTLQRKRFLKHTKLKCLKPRCVLPGHTDTDCDIQAYDPWKYLQEAVYATRYALSISSKCVRIHWARE